MDFVFVGGIVLLVLLGHWVLVWRTNSKRKRERDEDHERWHELTSRIYVLEQTVRGLQVRRPSPVEADATPKTFERDSAVSSAPTYDSPIAVPPPVEPTSESSPSVRIAENWVTQKTASLSTPAPTPVTPLPAPSFATKGIDLSIADRLKSSLDIEEMLGTSWLNKLGIVILVLGVAFFLAYQLKTLGPAGKVLVGFATAP
jgi:uncharacterized membrane protein